MFSRRTVLTGLAASAVTGCGGRQQRATALGAYYPYPAAPPPPDRASQGLDAVIDISHGVGVSDFQAVRASGILAVIHKATEGGDYVDAGCAVRRPQAEAAGLLWGAYHFGTRQYSGAKQAAFFLAIVRPGPKTLMALDLEPNDGNPRNTMTLTHAEDFVRAIYQATGRLPVIYTHPTWANGGRYGRAGQTLGRPIEPGSLLSRCDLWLADYHDEPEVPSAWAGRGWKLWQYSANESVKDAAYGTTSRAINGVDFCDRNLFNGNTSELYKFWGAGTARA